MLCPTILAPPAPAVVLKEIGRKRMKLTIMFYVADTPSLPGARNNLLRHVRRFIRHSGADLTQPVDDRPLADVRRLPQERVEAIRTTYRPRRVNPGAAHISAGDIVDRLTVVKGGVLDLVIGTASTDRARRPK